MEIFVVAVARVLQHFECEVVAGRDGPDGRRRSSRCRTASATSSRQPRTQTRHSSPVRIARECGYDLACTCFRAPGPRRWLRAPCECCPVPASTPPARARWRYVPRAPLIRRVPTASVQNTKRRWSRKLTNVARNDFARLSEGRLHLLDPEGAVEELDRADRTGPCPALDQREFTSEQARCLGERDEIRFRAGIMSTLAPPSDGAASGTHRTKLPSYASEWPSAVPPGHRRHGL